MAAPVRIINSVAPIRICDNGGWTDTWFAEYGAIFNIGVLPYAEAQLKVLPRDEVDDRGGVDGNFCRSYGGADRLA